MKKSKPQNRMFFTVGQTVALAAGAASFAAVSTALFASHWFSLRFHTIHGDSFGTIVSRTVIASNRVPQEWRSPWPNVLGSEALLNEKDRYYPSKYQQIGSRRQESFALDTATGQASPNHLSSIAWLMSFPNSGTSFTLHLTREASNCTTASNYALEGEIKDQPSVPAIALPRGSNGPWLEIIPNRTTTVPRFILTKTHCGGYCSYCPTTQYIETPRSFQNSCQSGTKEFHTEQGEMKKKVVTYDSQLVKKAIHIIRHPLDNIVARFHLDHRRQLRGGNAKKSALWPKTFARNATGFQQWCEFLDTDLDLLSLHWIDKRLRDAFDGVPCKAEFFRYVQWHNMAFTVIEDMDIPSLIVHYEDYQFRFEETLDQILHFLELPRSYGMVEFVPGKEYRDYYSEPQKEAIQTLLNEFATRKTREQLERYTVSRE